MPTKSQIIKEGQKLLTQNQDWETTCPICNREIKLKSKQVFTGKDEVEVVCPKCKVDFTISNLKEVMYNFGKVLF